MKRKFQLNDAFENALQEALRNLHSTQTLGELSPLAQPYFLGALLRESASPAQRGEALQRAIQQAWQALWGGEPPANEPVFLTQFHDAVRESGKGRQYQAFVLELRFLHRVIHPPKLDHIWENYLQVSKAQFHRDLAESVQALGWQLLTLLAPHLRLERPTPPPNLYGRAAFYRHLFETLQSGKNVSLVGASGMGKTSLAARVCLQWPGQAVFWYAIRPGLSDNLGGLLFSLAIFLREQGQTSLWQQIVADDSRIQNLEIAQNLARHDLASLTGQALIVLDDLDQLSAERSDLPRILGFLESMQSQVTLLLVGQREVFPTPENIHLDGLAPEDLSNWLEDAHRAATRAEIGELCQYTSGNPRLITLALSLLTGGISIPELLIHFRKSPGAPALFNHLWMQLDEPEQRSLLELSVFRGTAPADAWRDRFSAMQTLQQRHLVRIDSSGGCSLLPAWAELAIADISPEQKEALHHWAAGVRAERGEFTEAAYHYWQAGYPEVAIQIWYPKQAYCIETGQARAARNIFSAISPQRLPDAEKQALFLIRARLAQLDGDYASGLRDLQSIAWERPTRISAQARALRGSFLRELGYSENASQEYQAGLDILANLMVQQIVIHGSRVTLLRRERNFSQIWHEIKRAQYEIEDLQGVVLDNQGQSAEAETHYLKALALAEEIGYVRGIAGTCNNLFAIAAKKGDHATAERLYPVVLQYYEKTGETVRANAVRNNWVVFLMQTKRYAEAVQPARELVDFYIQIGHKAHIAVSAGNLAEIQFNLGHMDEAQHWAKISLAQEQNASTPWGLYYLGMVACHKKQLAQAEIYLNEALESARKGQDSTAEAYAWRGLGLAYAAQGKTEQAQTARQKAIDLFTALQLENEVEITRQDGF